MRTLAVDALRMVGRRTAQGRLVEYLAYEWSRMEIPFDRILFMAPRRIELPDLGTKTEITADVFGTKLPFVVWEQMALPLRSRSAAVLFCPTYIGPIFSGAPMVVANHGIYERTPEEFSRVQRLRSTTLHRLSARRASRLIANSRNTRTDLAAFFGVPERDIDVVYPAASPAFFAEPDSAAVKGEVERAFGECVPFFIFVGKLSRRRHVPELIEAFGRLRAKGDVSHRLLIVGPNTTRLDISGIAAAHSVENAVKYVPHLDQQALARLYAGADAFVLPTTYEGISYTMFEAMASGTPVITVEHPTLAEGARDTALVAADPTPEALFDAMRTLAGDEELRRDLGRRGRERAAEFSWTRNAQETAAILDSVARAADQRLSRPVGRTVASDV